MYVVNYRELRDQPEHQNNMIFRKMINLGHTYFSLVCLHKGSGALYAFYIFSIKVKYREEYEKNKGKSMLEFVETPSYQASKEAQKMQSEASPFGLFSTVQHLLDVLSFKRNQGSGSECLVGLEDPAQGDRGNHRLCPCGQSHKFFPHLSISFST